MKKMPTAAIFDMDGVVVDTREAHRESWEVLGRETGHRMTDELFAYTFGMHNRVIMPMLFGREMSDDEIHKYAERKEDAFRDIIRGKVKPLAGVLDLVGALREAGWLLAMASSAPRVNIRFLLEAVGAREMFPVVVGYEDVTHGKPAAECFLTAALRLGVEPARCVVIEDAPAGVKAACAAGMKVIAITSTVSAQELDQADMVIDSFAELNVERIEKLLEG